MKNKPLCQQNINRCVKHNINHIIINNILFKQNNFCSYIKYIDLHKFITLSLYKRLTCNEKTTVLVMIASKQIKRHQRERMQLIYA